MRPKLVSVWVSLIALFSLTGCMDTSDTDQENDNNNEENGQVSTDLSPEEARPKPPVLSIQVGEETLSPVLGTYSWNVEDEDRTFAGIEVDAVAPPELVRTTEPMRVTAETSIKLNFEEEPERYSVKIWDDDNAVLSELDEVDLSGEGEVIYEVLAHWDKGTASYAFILTIE